MDPIWYFSCLCRKFRELRALLFLSSTQTSQNLKFIQKCPRLSSLKTSLVNSKNVWPLIRKILVWTFWHYKRIFKRCNSWECSFHFFRGPWIRYTFVVSRFQILLQQLFIAAIICHNDELRSSLCWLDCLLTDSEVFFLICRNWSSPSQNSFYSNSLNFHATTAV